MSDAGELQEIDCRKYEKDCKRLLQMVENGLSDADLQNLGIAANSKEASDVLDAVFQILLHCCARAGGTQPPPPPPTKPGPAIAVGTTLTLTRPPPPAILTLLRSALATAMEYATLSTVAWLAVVVAAVAVVNSGRGIQVCYFVRSRPRSDGLGTECLYKCPDGTLYYETDFFGVGCLPFITKPI